MFGQETSTHFSASVPASQSIFRISRVGALLENNIFPVFDQIARYFSVPEALSVFCYVYICFQAISVALWTNIDSFWGSSREFEIWQYVAFWSADGPFSTSFIIAFVVIMVETVLSAAFAAFQILFYRRNARLLIWTITPTMIFLDIVPNLVLTPTLMLSSRLVQLIAVRATARDCVLFSFLLICYIVNVCFMVPVKVFVSNTFYSANRVTFNYSPYHFISFSILNSVFALCGGLFRLYPRWAGQVLMAGHVAVSVVLFVWLIRIIYISQFTNALFMAALIAQVCADACRIAEWPYDQFWICVIVACVFAVSFLISLIGVRLYFWKIRRLLAYDGKMSLADYPDSERVKPTLTDDEKEEAIANLKLGRRTAVTYLFIGLKYCSDYVVDMTLVRYLMYSDNSTYCLCHLLHVVCYFPTTIKLLDKIYRELKQRRDLSTSQYFLLFEVYRVKLQRLTSSTPFSMGRLTELRSSALYLEAQQRGFWTGHGTQISQLLDVGNQTRVLNGQWQEILRFNSNSIAYHEDYLRFLIEVRCDFQAAIHMRNRIDIMERKRIRKADQCFIRFVQLFPQYLRRKIVNANGGMLAYHTRREDGSSGTHSSSVDSQNEVDVPTEELLAKRILRYGNLSLALGKAVRNMKPHSRIGFMFFSLWALFGSIASLLIAFSLCFSVLHRPQDTNECLRKMFEFHQYLAETFLAVVVQYARKMGTFNYDVNMFGHGTLSPWESPDTNFDEFSWNLSLVSASAFSTFVTETTNLAINDQSSKWLSDVFVSATTGQALCHDGRMYRVETTDILSVSSYLLAYLTAVICKETNWNEIWHNNSYWCASIYSQVTVSFALEKVLEAVMNNILESLAAIDNTCRIMMPIAPGLFIILVILGTPVFTIRVMREIGYFVKMLQSVDDAAKQEAAEPIFRALSNEDRKVSPASWAGNNAVVILYTVFICFFGLVSMALLVLILWKTRESVAEFRVLQQWQYYASSRIARVFEVVGYVFTAILTNDMDNPTQTSGQASAYAEEIMVVIDKYSELIRSNAGDNRDIYGYDEQLDRILTTAEDCNPVAQPGKLHDVYKCYGSAQLFISFGSLASSILSDLGKYKGSVSEEDPANLLHIAIVHVLTATNDIKARCLILERDVIDSDESSLVLILLAGIVSSFITFGLAFNLLLRLDVAYQVVVALLKRLSPVAIVSHPNLMHYVLGKEKARSMSNSMGTTQSIVYNSSDGILLASAMGMIDSVNPAVTHILGFSPEQVLGQQMSVIFDPKRRPDVEKQIQLMRNGQSSSIYEDQIDCQTDDEQLVPCQITILALFDGGTEVQSWVLMVKDISLIHQQRLESEKAKRKSETLLYNILPRVIVARINAGERDVTFSVPDATIMFVDIVKFSEYMAFLSPQQIMGTLSALFGSFDKRAADTKSLTKIKLIGDVYMCAAGLFNQLQPDKSAEEMILFGLACLQILEDVNIKLNTSLSVRIGVNTGGPIIAGVLGTDNRVFDIIGDPINVASRLQSTSLPNMIQLSQSTYDYVVGLGLQMRKRDRVFLKGKGDVSTYLLSNDEAYAT